MSVFASIPLLIVMAVIISLPIMIAVYVYRDANRRGMNAILWALVAAIAPALIGLIVYLLVRGNYSDLRCPKCDAPVVEQYVVCPKCGTKLRASCPSCATPVEPGWKVCPKCTQQLPEYQTDIQVPVRAKDKSLWKVLAIVLIIPIVLITVMVLSFSVYMVSSGSTAYREVSVSEYFDEMRSEVDAGIADKVETWLDDVDETQNGAYALRYEHKTDSGNGYYYLVYIPSIGGEQSHSGIGRSSNIFGTTLTLELSSHSGERELFTFMVSSDDDHTPNLKVTIDGKKIPCNVTTVTYNPTLFYIAPQYDVLDPEAADYWTPERISVVKLISNQNEGVAEVEDEDIARDILVGIDSAPYLELEHKIYGNPDGTGGYNFTDGFEIIVEYKVHEDLVLHEDMLHCLVFEQDGAYYLADDRPDNGRIIRTIDEAFYQELLSLFE